MKFCLPGDRVLHNVIDNIIDNRDDCERDDLERKRKENVIRVGIPSSWEKQDRIGSV